MIIIGKGGKRFILRNWHVIVFAIVFVLATCVNVG